MYVPDLLYFTGLRFVKHLTHSAYLKIVLCDPKLFVHGYIGRKIRNFITFIIVVIVWIILSLRIIQQKKKPSKTNDSLLPIFYLYEINRDFFYYELLFKNSENEIQQ